jgi:hypothetical protein
MDRLDSWLNRQHGWRLALLLWIILLPAAAIIALGAWSWFGAGTSDSRLVLLESGTCSLAAMALIAGLATASPNRRTKPLSWRAIVGVILVSSGAVLGSATDQLAGWPHLHRAIAGVMLALTASGGVFFVTAWLHQRRLADAAGAGHPKRL